MGLLPVGDVYLTYPICQVSDRYIAPSGRPSLREERLPCDLLSLAPN